MLAVYQCYRPALLQQHHQQQQHHKQQQALHHPLALLLLLLSRTRLALPPLQELYMCAPPPLPHTWSQAKVSYWLCDFPLFMQSSNLFLGKTRGIDLSAA
jgi:hypothetical protein